MKERFVAKVGHTWTAIKAHPIITIIVVVAILTIIAIIVVYTKKGRSEHFPDYQKELQLFKSLSSTNKSKYLEMDKAEKMTTYGAHFI